MRISEISADINRNARQKGFWEKLELDKKMLLIHSEVSEMCEADRKDHHADNAKYANEMTGISEKDDLLFEKHIKNSFEDEIADTVIRCFDLAYQLGIDLEWHIKMKHDYNTRRPFKHGKKY